MKIISRPVFQNTRADLFFTRPTKERWKNSNNNHAVHCFWYQQFLILQFFRYCIGFSANNQHKEVIFLILVLLLKIATYLGNNDWLIFLGKKPKKEQRESFSKSALQPIQIFSLLILIQQQFKHIIHLRLKLRTLGCSVNHALLAGSN